MSNTIVPYNGPRPINFLKYAVSFAVFWTVCIVASLVWNIQHIQEDTRNFAINEAKASFNKDQAFRMWATSHGGVYVPVDEKNQPNKWLSQLPERDVTTPSGRLLTLMNPSSMVRQLMEDFANQYGVKGHITSLNPLCPANKPDEWEAKALASFEHGGKEYFEFVDYTGEPHLRYMQPMVVKDGCLKCHAAQGYSKGDIRGGVGVSVPLAPFVEIEEEHVNALIMSHGIIWLLGLLGIVMGSHRIGRNMDRRMQAEYFIRDVLESVGEALIVISPDYTIVSANKEFCRQTGMPHDKIIGEKCYRVTHHIDTPCPESGEECPIRDTFLSGESSSVVHTHHDADGNPIYVEIRAYPMKDAQGNVTSAIEVINDITDKRKFEEQLWQSQKMEAIGTLTGGIAHDFNNMLTTILGFSELLKDEMVDDDPRRGYVDMILSSGEKATLLTQGLLAFSRKQVIHTKVVDLCDVARKTMKMLARLIGEDIEISLDLPEDPLMVVADGVQIEQVLMNLATNARDSMTGGGKFIIHCESMNVDDDFATAHAFESAGQYALLSVTDSGKGMDEQTRQQIFEPFFTTKDIGKGTGLGMSVVYGIVKQHKGYITVYSELGKGTTFKIYLPVAVEGAQAEPELTSESVVGGSETIMIAEDDDAIRTLLRNVLQTKGYKTIEAEDGEEAIAKFIKHQDEVDLIVLDVVMPKKNGVDAFKKIRDVRPDIKAIFMSGYPPEAITDVDIKEVHELIQKPISPRDLLKRIRELLGNGA